MGLLIALAGCGGDDDGGPTDPSDPPGTLEVSTTTTGEDMDPDGYMVTVGNRPPRAIGVNATIEFTDLAPGEYTVGLSEVAANCTVAGENPRQLNVSSGNNASADFEVQCAQRTGTLTVTTSTTGEDIDGDGYTVTVDGSETLEAPANGTVQFTDLSTGEHTVELSGVATNCSAQGENPRTVELVADQAAATTFEVTCAARAGGLEVSTVTTGDQPDPDGYTVTVNDGEPEAIGVNATVTFSGLSEGEHTVELGDIEPNCTLSGENPRTVSVTTGETTSTTFELECIRQAGMVEVTTVTSGDNQDTGYRVTVDGGDPRDIGANETIRFEVAAGDRSIALTDIASNCGVDGENPRVLTVEHEGEVSTTFEVGCWTALTNQIAFESNRDGNNEIYLINPDGSGQSRLTNHAGSDRMPAIAPDGNAIAFASDRDRTGGQDIFLMGPNGTGVVNLTEGVGANNWGPAWSPDGAWIVFVRVANGDRDIFVMRADGSQVTNLTPGDDDGNDDLPSWSPDGRQITFFSDRDGDLDIYVMNADGTNPVNITNDVTNDEGEPSNEGNPDWGPDGRIAFTSDRDGNLQVYLTAADGTGLQLITDQQFQNGEAAWSADGSTIAFVSDRDDPVVHSTEVYVMNPDGTNVRRVTDSDGSNVSPSFRAKQ